MLNEDMLKIPEARLRRVCNYEEELYFCTNTKDVEPYDGVIGQDRAARSMEFGLKIDAPGYNIFVVGPQGTGKSTYAQAIVSKEALKGPAPEDWCYINNFNDEDQPLIVSLPAGQGKKFQNDMKDLVEDFKIAIPKAFEGNVYEQKKDAKVQTVQKKVAELFRNIEIEANAAGFNLQHIPPRFMFIPVRDGKPLPPEEFEKLSQQEREEIEDKWRKLGKKLDETVRESQMLEKQANDEIVELGKEAAMAAATIHVDKLIKKYEAFPKIVEYLEALLKDVRENHMIFQTQDAIMPQMPYGFPQERVDNFIRYKVNLFVNNEKCEGSPVVFETSPFYYNIFGKIEYKSQVLAVSTDLTMVKAGAIHRANGGYLILQIKDILMDPYSWEPLKKAIKYSQAIVENIGEQYRLVPSVALKPEPVPLKVKVILIGSPYIFEMLHFLDEDFRKLFKVKVDFDIEMPRTPENLRKYVSFVGWLCIKENIKHFSREGLGQIIEYSSYLAGDQNKLSTSFNELTEVIYEASNLANIQDSEFVEKHHVKEALNERKARADKVEKKVQEEMLRGHIIVKTEGAEVGQINGLSVVEIGGYTFGLPSRITARTYVGFGGVINIERETEMSGNIHSKGVLTLAGYLGGKFGQKKPMGLTAQITFEQNYSGVEGDSASSTELYSILSSISGIPLKQSLAVTGSVDQRGEIQPIGGVTQKIEGFFDLCNSKGLTGDHGVIIPVQNIDNLMLKDEIINAVKENKFHIYAIKNIEEGIELLTGVPAGIIEADGKYTTDSIFSKIENKLEEFSEGLSSVGIDSIGVKPKAPK